MKVGARIYYGWWIVVAAFLNLCAMEEFSSH